MDIIKIIGIGIVGAVLSLIVKEYKPVFSVCIGVLTATVIFFLILSQLSYALDVVGMLASRLSIDDVYIKIIIRIIGMAYVSRLGSEVCRDAGQNAVAQKIELAGKIMIVASSIPILTSVLNLLLGILPG
ncbi:MAG: stage III sporulation protein AD [Ruminococcaceae bacterium]|nr:stage III sporulation protein AD [Oscillospiraceae bacterium]